MNLVIATRSLTVGIAAAICLLTAPLVQAHVALVKSTPAADAVVVSPTSIDLVFNETLVPRASRLELSLLHGAEATPVEHFDTEIVNDGKTLRAKLHQALAGGTYRVQWRAVGADNHPRTGDFKFTIR